MVLPALALWPTSEYSVVPGKDRDGVGWGGMGWDGGGGGEGSALRCFALPPLRISQ
jgi:hypothetical protein